jgi:hypothetical protein
VAVREHDARSGFAKRREPAALAYELLDDNGERTRLDAGVGRDIVGSDQRFDYVRSVGDRDHAAPAAGVGPGPAGPR